MDERIEPDYIHWRTLYDGVKNLRLKPGYSTVNTMAFVTQAPATTPSIDIDYSIAFEILHMYITLVWFFKPIHEYSSSKVKRNLHSTPVLLD
jgi:hypothetical protein